MTKPTTSPKTTSPKTEMLSMALDCCTIYRLARAAWAQHEAALLAALAQEGF